MPSGFLKCTEQNNEQGAAKNGTDVEIAVQEIRECCDCEDKYPAFGNFKDKVIDRAVTEINRVTMFRVDYSYRKKGRSVVAIIFHVNMMYYTL